MTLEELFEYLRVNACGEYNMQSLINSIKNDTRYVFRYVSGSIECDNMYIISIDKKRPENPNQTTDYALLYFKYTHINNDNLFDYENNTIRPLCVRYCDNNDVMRLNGKGKKGEKWSEQIKESIENDY